MSELAPGSMSLEVDETPVETPPPAQETPAQAPDTPQQAADADPEGTVVNPGGEKLVPLGALAGAREKVREKEAALAAKEAEIAALKEKATKYDQVAGEWQAAQPLLQQLRNGTYQPPQPKPQVDEAAIRYARDLDLYKADGQPDVERARRILDHNAAQAQEIAKSLVQPIYQNTAQQQSASNFEAAAGFKDKSGIQVDRGILEQYWKAVPAELSSQQGVAALLYKAAYADTLMAGKGKPPVVAPGPPVVTESLGGNTAQPKELTAIDRSMMSAANIKPKDYESISANFKPGQTNSLE